MVRQKNQCVDVAESGISSLRSLVIRCTGYAETGSARPGPVVNRVEATHPQRDRAGVNVHGQGGGLGLKIETRHTREPGVLVSGDKGYPKVVGSIASVVSVSGLRQCSPSRRESPPRTCHHHFLLSSQLLSSGLRPSSSIGIYLSSQTFRK